MMRRAHACSPRPPMRRRACHGPRCGGRGPCLSRHAQQRHAQQRAQEGGAYLRVLLSLAHHLLLRTNLGACTLGARLCQRTLAAQLASQRGQHLGSGFA